MRRRARTVAGVSVSFAVQAHPGAADEWVQRARRAEALGFEAFCIADHPGATAARRARPSPST